MSFPLLPLVVFTLAACITPGPNNVMVAASAANHGLRATLPHAAGIAVGFAVMIVLVGLGVAGVLAELPRLLGRALRWVAVGWLLLIALRIARAGAPGSGPARPPMGFLGAAMFQWVNPKAWLMAVGATGAFISPTQPMAPQLATVAGVFFAATVPCVLGWAALGSAAGRLLHSPLRLRAFNIGMAALMVASMLPVAFGE